MTNEICQPVPLFRRDPSTGLVVGKTYQYTPEGKIDWRSEVPIQFLYVANEYRDRVVADQGKPLNEIDLLKVKDDWLRIRVGGLNYLAHLRGVRSCTYPHMQTRDGFCGVSCEITFIGNIESNMEPETWSSMASACRASMDKQFLPYLETFAENRAFGRCVKRALQINILSDIEVGGDGKKGVDEAAPGDTSASPPEEDTSSGGFQPHHYLATKCKGNKGADGKPSPITFAALKDASIAMNANTPPDKANERCVSDPSTWTDWESIPPADAWLLMGKIDAAAAKEGAGKKGKSKA
jgi:hypothetical protein